MRRIVFTIISFLCFSVFNAQSRKKDYKDIMKSNNIYEINAFLRDAHPNDPRREILKPKVMELMQEYLRTALPFDQKIPQIQEMLALLKNRPSTRVSYEEFTTKIRERHLADVKEQINKMSKISDEEAQNLYKQYAEGNSGEAVSAASGIANYTNPEEEEFNKLVSITSDEHKKKTVKILNSLFDNDPSSKEVIVMVENKSDCNIIVRMEGAGGNNYKLPVPSKKENSIVIEKGSYLFTSLVCGAQYASQKDIKKPIMVVLENPKNN